VNQQGDVDINMPQLRPKFVHEGHKELGYVRPSKVSSFKNDEWEDDSRGNKLLEVKSIQNKQIVSMTTQ
jgi:hypothetical protein